VLSRRRTLGGLAGFAGFTGISALAGCGRSSPDPERASEPIAGQPAGPATQTLILANIHTNDPTRPRAEALLIRDGKILAVGSRADFDGLPSAVARLDWRDATVLPGLTDAHAHLLGLGQSREIVDLRGAASVAEVVTRLEAGAPSSGWVLGRGWDQNLWGGAMPSAAELDVAFPDRPVWLRRVDGHAGWANSAALRLANIDSSTNDPEGGEILRDPSSRAATGVLIDTAMDRIPVPEPSPAEVERWLRAATHEAASLGLTGVHEMGVDADSHAVFERLASAGELPIRVHGYASEAWFDAGQGTAGHPSRPSPSPVVADTRYALVGVKLYADGALGSRGAALLEPYADRPGHRGALMHEPARFVELVTAIDQRGLQIATHAIGDRGIRTILDAYATLPRPHVGARRARIEHAQIIALADIPRMAELDLVASMQPTHATSDMAWVPERVGPERVAGAYAWRRMLTAGVPLALGSDFPVEQPSPLLGLHAAVTRQDLDGQPAGGWLPDQRLSVAEAVAGFCSGAAYAVGREGHLGRIAPGFRADLSCLAGDPFEVEAGAIPTLEVRATMVEGALVYQA
jgi:predicted amidohydrolase YtcJ